MPQWDNGASGNTKLVETEGAIEIAGDHAHWTIDKKTGRIKKGEIDGHVVVSGGPDLMVLPIKGNGDMQMTGEKKSYPAFTDTCHEWQLAKITTAKGDRDVKVVIEGGYKEAAGSYELLFDGAGRVTVKDHFTILSDINPRQVGLVFRVDKRCNTLEWDRNALWTVYPEDHIGRAKGTAKAFREGPDTAVGTQPSWPWELDNSPLGTNDFRATRRNIVWAALKDEDGFGVRAESDGKQHARAYVDGEQICLLIADIDTGSGEGFLATHYAVERKLLKQDDVIEGTVIIRMMDKR
jgi:hypothetical protein